MRELRRVPMTEVQMIIVQYIDSESPRSYGIGTRLIISSGDSLAYQHLLISAM
jgi:hypothetical protein